MFNYRRKNLKFSVFDSRRRVCFGVKFKTLRNLRVKRRKNSGPKGKETCDKEWIYHGHNFKVFNWYQNRKIMGW